MECWVPSVDQDTVVIVGDVGVELDSQVTTQA